MPILGQIFSWLSIKRMSEIELFMKYPIDTQNETLLKLIKKAEETEWGKKYGYASLDRVEDFKEKIPVQDYETIKPYIIRLRQGEQNLLWPSEIKWFAKSSGTTSDKSKFIPVSKEALEDCHFRGGKDILALYFSHFPESKLLKGKCLSLGGSHQINNFSNESYYGDLSAVLIQNLPFWAEMKRTPNLEITLMEEWDDKIEQMAKASIKENVTYIAGVPSWTLVLIKYILEITGAKHLQDVWPQLELFAHGGVSFVPYREQFKRLIPGNSMNYMETYNASEGFFGLQDDPDRDDMLLMLDYGIYYEFMPLSEVGKDHPKLLSLDEVQTGENYALVISTNAGLWRYVIGDTVIVTHRYPFKIKITGRIKHFINAFGEELIIDNAENALKMACDKTGAQVREYTAGPIFMDKDVKGGHEWLFEFEKKPNNIEYFVEVLDNALKSLNSDYEAKRYKNMTLDFPVIRILNDGTFYTWLKERGKLGGQHKVPRLSNNRTYIEQLLKINNTKK
ncbi:MAG: hypothetical protein C0594_04510 [Marinilabiliales bacterium]|nr:MAG: hypothetical protein C0594_04510 [Marinilabiliales bacterium]